MLLRLQMYTGHMQRDFVPLEQRSGDGKETSNNGEYEETVELRKLGRLVSTNAARMGMRG